MSPLWWLEGVNLLISLLGAVTCLVAAALFFVVFQFEKKTTTLWRPFGFLLLAIAFCLQALSAITATVLSYQSAATLELFAIFLIYRGVYSEPIVSHLNQVASLSERTTATRVPLKNRFPRGSSLLLIVAILAVPVVVGHPYAVALINLLTVFWMALTMRLQWKRYRWEQDSPAIRRQNLLALLAYIFLLARAVAFSLYYASRSPAWPAGRPGVGWAIATYVAMLIATALGLYFLMRWVWIFIRVRSFLRNSFVSVVALITAWVVGMLIVIPLILGGLIFLLLRL